MHYIGLDIGGSKTMVASFSAEGVVYRRKLFATARERQQGLRDIVQAIDDVTGATSPAAIGAACGGPLERISGRVSPLHQPDWRDVPLKELLEERFGCPLAVDVDTNIAALAEWHFSEPAGRGTLLLYVTLSTGMGAALVHSGRLYRGAHDAHPELGHQVVDYSGEAVWCSCGARNCLEALVSGSAIRKRFGVPAQELSANDWQEIGRLLGSGLRNAVLMYAPDRVVLGGGVALGAGEKLLEPARRILQDNVKLVLLPPLSISTLGYGNVLMGTAVLALEAAAVDFDSRIFKSNWKDSYERTGLD